MSPQVGVATTVEIDAKIATHKADLDAHTRDWFQTFRTGHYIYTTPGQQSTKAVTAGRLHAVPFVVTRPMTIDRIGVQVTTGHASSCRVGIYNDGTNLYPGTLLVDAGTFDATDAALKEVTISGDQVLTRGLYWMALLSEGTPTLQRLAYCFNPLGFSPTAINAHADAWVVAQAYGALPDPFTGGGAITPGCGLTIAPRLKSLD